MKLNLISKKGLLINIQSFILFFLVMNIHAGTPHFVAGSITYSGGGFPSALTFSAYIVSRPGEVLTEASAGCAFYSSTGQYTVQCGTFSSWTAGDVLHIDVNDGASGLASGEIALTNDAYDELNMVIIPPPPPAPLIGTITHPTCEVSTGSVELSGLPDPWTLTRTPGGSTSGTGTSTTVSGLAAGTYYWTVTNSIGGTSASSENAILNTQPSTPAAPAVGTITHPTCEVSTGSVVLSGLPDPWTLTRTPGGSSSGTGTSTTVSGLSAGTYTFTVTNATGCTSVSSGNVVLNAQPSTPAAPAVGTITHPTCTLATGSVLLSGLPTGNWTINPGGINGTGTSTTISGLVAGTYNFTVTNASGCISPASANVVINVNPATPAAPTAGTVTQPTCIVATGSVVLNSLPSSETWTLTITPGETTTTGSGASTTISGLAADTYTWTVTNASGCVSASSAMVTINVQPETPSAPVIGTITQPTGEVSAGSVVLNGLPAGGWTINPGTIAGTGTSTTVSGLSAGTHTFIVTNESGCISAASDPVVINAVPVITGQNLVVVKEDSSFMITVLNLIISDPDNTPAEMTVIIGSGDNYHVSGGNTIEPSSDYNGLLTVPVTVNDGIATSNIFNLSVNVLAVNDVPVILDIPDMEIDMNENFIPVNLCEFIDDVETQDDNITWNITGDDYLNILINNCIATITVKDPSWFGSDTITFTATDDDPVNPLSVSEDVILTVNDTSTTGINRPLIENVTLYPNPVTEYVILSFNNRMNGNLTVEISTITGEIFSVKKYMIVNNIVEVDMHAFNSGIYLLRIISNDKTNTFKVIKY